MAPSSQCWGNKPEFCPHESQQIETTLSVSLAIFVIAIFIFSCIRQKITWRKYIEPRRYISLQRSNANQSRSVHQSSSSTNNIDDNQEKKDIDSDTKSATDEIADGLATENGNIISSSTDKSQTQNELHTFFQNIDRNYVAWITDMFKLSPQNYMNYIGLDAVVFIIFIRSCIKICLMCMPFAALILMPVYASENTGLHDDAVSDFVKRIAVSALEKASNRLWVVCVMAYVFSFVALKVIYDDCQVVAQLVDRFVTIPHISHRTVMVTKVPQSYIDHKFDNSSQKSMTDLKLYHLFNQYFPNQIRNISIPIHIDRTLSKQFDYYEKRVKNLDDAKIKRAQGFKGKVKVKTGFFKRELVDPIEYYENEIEKIKHLLQSNDVSYSSTAFIEFKTFTAASKCVNSKIVSNASYLIRRMAPYPDDIIWFVYMCHV